MRQLFTLLQPLDGVYIDGPTDFKVHYAAYLQEKAQEFTFGTLSDLVVDPDGPLTLIPSWTWGTGNLAGGKPVVASAAGTDLGRITDGSTSSGYASVEGGTVQYVQIDLEEVIPLDKVHMWHYFSDVRTYAENKLEISEDGLVWTTVFDSEIEGRYVETAEGKIVTFTETNVRYIRNWLNGSTANEGNHWVEIEAYAPPPTYPLTGYRKSPGYQLDGVATAESVITWTEVLASGTSLEIKTAVTDTDVAPADTAYTVVTQGAMPVGITADMDLTGKYLWIIETLTTTDIHETPRLSQVDVNTMVTGIEPIQFQCTIDRAWTDIATPYRMLTSLSSPLQPNSTYTWNMHLSHGYWYWKAQVGSIVSELNTVQAGPPEKRALAQYANVTKEPVLWSNRRALYQYTSVTKKEVQWSNTRGLFQYADITDDPPFPYIDRISIGRGPEGAHVTIYGNGFGYTYLNDAENEDRFLRGYGGFVYLGPMSCGIVSWSWTKIVFQVPVGAESGAIKVQLTVPDTRDSNLKGFEIYVGIPADDIGIELFVCESTSPNLIMRQLDAATGKAFQLMQNNAGSGSFKISRYDEAGGNRKYIAEGNLILVKLDGQPLFKWIIESVKPNYVESNEQQLIEVSGRGVLSILNQAVVYPESMGEPVLDRKFTGTASTVLRTLILEAQHRGGLPGIDIGWENDMDSIGNVFTEDVQLSFHVGTPLSEVVSKFTDGLGYFDIEMTPSLKLMIYKERGTDLHEEIVYRPGQAIVSQQHQIDMNSMVNEVLIEGNDKQLAIATHPESSAKYGRREGYLSASNVTSGLSEYGEAYLSRMALPIWGIQGTVIKFYDEEGNRLKPLENFALGDWIGWNIPPEGFDDEGFSDKVKVRGVTISEDDATGSLEYTLELNNTMLEHEIKLNQKVERFTQFSSNDVLSVAPSSTGTYSESEVNALLNQKAPMDHTHTGVYSPIAHSHDLKDLLDTPDSYIGKAGQVLKVKTDEAGIEFGTEPRSFMFFIGGTLAVKTNVISVIAPMNLRITGIRLSVDVAAGGTDIVCDINLNGTTLYSTQANRPKILTGTLYAVAALPDALNITLGDKVGIDVDQVGSLVKGENLSVTIICEVV